MGTPGVDTGGMLITPLPDSRTTSPHGWTRAHVGWRRPAAPIGDRSLLMGIRGARGGLRADHCERPPARGVADEQLTSKTVQIGYVGHSRPPAAVRRVS